VNCVHKFKLIICNLQSQKSGFGVSRTVLGRPSTKTPSCLQEHPLHRSIDSACILEKKGNENHAYFHKSWGKIRGRKIKLLKHVFALYCLPVIFSKIFSLDTLARLRLIFLVSDFRACILEKKGNEKHAYFHKS